MRTVSASVNPLRDAHEPGSAEWWRTRSRDGHDSDRPARAGGITSACIAGAAVEIIEREGLDAVSMRRVAAALGTGAASLYRHIRGRDELLVIITDELLGARLASAVEMSAGRRASGWRARCESHAHVLRAVLLESPALLTLVGRAQLLGPNALRAREASLASLVAAGFSEALAVRTYLSLTHYVIGAAQLDNRSTKRNPADQASLQRLFREADSCGCPTVSALADGLGGMHPDDEFEFGLSALLDGIAARFEADRRRPARRNGPGPKDS